MTARDLLPLRIGLALSYAAQTVVVAVALYAGAFVWALTP